MGDCIGEYFGCSYGGSFDLSSCKSANPYMVAPFFSTQSVLSKPNVSWIETLRNLELYAAHLARKLFGTLGSI